MGVKSVWIEEFSDIPANQIYVSYTKANTGGYETPLYLVQWA